jgi:predicted enzyme related to lactoylglutathione lyase
MPTFSVTGVDFVFVPTTDLATTKRFYESVLGLPCSVEYERLPGAEFETGTLTLQVIETDAIGREFRPNPWPIALRVADVPAAREELEARGVSFHGETLDSGVCHQAFFEDPDGNVFALHHRYAPR